MVCACTKYMTHSYVCLYLFFGCLFIYWLFYSGCAYPYTCVSYVCSVSIHGVCVGMSHIWYSAHVLRWHTHTHITYYIYNTPPCHRLLCVCVCCVLPVYVCAVLWVVLSSHNHPDCVPDAICMQVHACWCLWAWTVCRSSAPHSAYVSAVNTQPHTHVTHCDTHSSIVVVPYILTTHTPYSVHYLLPAHPGTIH